MGAGASGSALRALLAEGLAELGVSLGEKAIEQLLTYAGEAARWAQRINITGFREPERVVREGVLRSLRLLPFLPEGDRIRLADVGSGAGFPGIPLKVARPDLRVTLIEASRRRASFLLHSIRLLGLDGIVCLRGRVEVLSSDPAIRRAFDVVAARALAPLREAIPLLAPLLAPGGSLLLLQGKSKELPLGVVLNGMHEIELKRVSGTPLLQEETVAVIKMLDVSRETSSPS